MQPCIRGAQPSLTQQSGAGDRTNKQGQCSIMNRKEKLDSSPHPGVNVTSCQVKLPFICTKGKWRCRRRSLPYAGVACCVRCAPIDYEHRRA